MKIYALPALLVLAACGPDSTNSPAPPQVVDANFSGRWSGVTTVTEPSQPPYQYASSVDVIANGDMLKVLSFCPNATGTITAQGSGSSVSWEGDVACPAPTAACPSTTIHYYRATAELVTPSNINLSGSGLIIGCPTGHTFTSVFRGTK